MSRQVVIAVAALLFGVILLAILGIGIAVLVTVLNQKYSSGGSVVGTTTEATAPAVSYSPESDRFAKNLFSRINFSVDPCEDFYEYACGRWAESNPVPAYLSSWSEYTKVSMQVSQDVKNAIENADLATSSEGVKKTKHFYDKCMDAKASEELKGTKLGALLHSGVSEDPSLPGFDKGSGKWPLIDKSYKGNVKWEQRIGHSKNPLASTPSCSPTPSSTPCNPTKRSSGSQAKCCPSASGS
ncbi:hypothetical protein L596_013051 [Steinernema carpocapsae]|uniref:Peptidase M13 N-terminal domain-containing protein n=1 Tax=Steinernema carpocapsae TaxID=34508 RepID=A0A4U5NZ31_STECR|nr:hypothetical protein L596_013051 [Steinernema carpocapsae]